MKILKIDHALPNRWAGESPSSAEAAICVPFLPKSFSDPQGPQLCGQYLEATWN